MLFFNGNNETETKYESALFYFLKCYNNSEIY